MLVGISFWNELVLVENFFWKFMHLRFQDPAKTAGLAVEGESPGEGRAGQTPLSCLAADRPALVWLAPPGMQHCAMHVLVYSRSPMSRSLTAEPQPVACTARLSFFDWHRFPMECAHFAHQCWLARPSTASRMSEDAHDESPLIIGYQDGHGPG